MHAEFANVPYSERSELPRRQYIIALDRCGSIQAKICTTETVIWKEARNSPDGFVVVFVIKDFPARALFTVNILFQSHLLTLQPQNEIVHIMSNSPAQSREKLDFESPEDRQARLGRSKTENDLDGMKRWTLIPRCLVKLHLGA